MNEETSKLSGVAARDEAMERAEAAAPEDWTAQAEKALDTLILQGEPFSSDNIWALVPKPPEPRALGPLLMRRARAGAIVRVGFRQTNQVSRHATSVAVWSPTK